MTMAGRKKGGMQKMAGRGGAMRMAGRKKGGMQQMAGRGGAMRMAGRKRGGKLTHKVPRSALKKGGAQYIAGHPQTLGAGKGGGLFGDAGKYLFNKAIDAAAPFVTAELNKKLAKAEETLKKATGVTVKKQVSQARVKAAMKSFKLSDVKNPGRAVKKLYQMFK